MTVCEKIGKELLRFVLPWACAGCRTAMRCLEDDGFCGRCWLQVKRIDGMICRQCGIPLPDGGASCYACQREPMGILVRAAATFSGPLRPAIHRLKYGGRVSLTRSLSILLRWAWDRYPELGSIDLVVPVPLHASTLRKRGYNQAEQLARTLVSERDPPIAELLKRQLPTKPQFALNRVERATNLWGAFGVQGSAPIKGKTVLLIDDICTTGSTLRECSRALRKAGAGQVVALVLAREA